VRPFSKLASEKGDFTSHLDTTFAGQCGIPQRAAPVSLVDRMDMAVC